MGVYSNTISCAEEAGTASESYDDFRGILRATVQVRCAWRERHDLVKDVCGNRREWPKGAAGLVPRAQTASIIPVLTPATGEAVKNGQEVIYDEALVTLNYTTEIVDVVSESIEPTAEFITLDHRWFRWASGTGLPVREEEAPGKLLRGINFVRNELDRQGVLDPNLLALVGRVNNQTVQGSILQFQFAKETLLYAPPVINYKKDSTGIVKYDITKKFTYEPEGWNKYFRPFAGEYQEIYLVGASDPYKSYILGDLASLLL